MKIKYVCALVAICGVLLSSCGNTNIDVKTVETDHDAAVEGTSVQIPPKLSVQSRIASADVFASGYSWNYLSDTGEYTSVIADSAHPLDQSFEPAIYKILPTPLSSVDPTVAYLYFDVAPDFVKAVAWSDEERGNTSAQSIAVDVGCDKDGMLYINLFEGSYIYEITAQWDDNGSYGGSATYVFETLFVVPVIPESTDDNLCGYPPKPKS